MNFKDLEPIFYERDKYGNPKHNYLYPNIAGNFFTRELLCYITYKEFLRYDTDPFLFHCSIHTFLQNQYLIFLL